MKKIQNHRVVVSSQQFAIKAITTSIVSLLVCSAAHAAPIPMVSTGGGLQEFDTLPTSGSATWADDSTLAGWYAQRTGVGSGLVIADDGVSGAGNLYSYGTGIATERALGSVSTSAAAFAYGVQMVNTTSAPMAFNFLSYTGEQWHKSGTTTPQSLTVWYKISPTLITSLNPEASNTGWTALPGADFNSPINTADAGALDGNADANSSQIEITPRILIPAGHHLMIRWKDSDHTGGDHGLAIDEVNLGWEPAPTPILDPGTIAVVGFNADGDNDLAFAALKFLAEDTVIHLSDNEWNGSAIGAGGAFTDTNEGIITWSAPLGGVSAGQVIQLQGLSTSTPTASVGTVTRSGGFSLNTTNETVYLYQGTPLAPTRFISAIATHALDSVVGTGITAFNVIYLPNDVDVAAYKGVRNDQIAMLGYFAQIKDTASNWDTEDGTGPQHNNGIIPDVPFATTAFTLAGFANVFDNWATINAGGGSFTQDFDKDGLSNGLEFFMGTAGNAGTPFPSIVAGAISWPRAPLAQVRSFKVEVSTDLITWVDATVSYNSNLTITSTLITFTLPSSPTKLFTRLTVVPVPGIG